MPRWLLHCPGQRLGLFDLRQRNLFVGHQYLRVPCLCAWRLVREWAVLCMHCRLLRRGKCVGVCGVCPRDHRCDLERKRLCGLCGRYDHLCRLWWEQRCVCGVSCGHLQRLPWQLVHELLGRELFRRWRESVHAVFGRLLVEQRRPDVHGMSVRLLLSRWLLRTAAVPRVL